MALVADDTVVDDDTAVDAALVKDIFRGDISAHIQVLAVTEDM